MIVFANTIIIIIKTFVSFFVTKLNQTNSSLSLKFAHSHYKFSSILLDSWRSMYHYRLTIIILHQVRIYAKHYVTFKNIIIMYKLKKYHIPNLFLRGHQSKLPWCAMHMCIYDHDSYVMSKTPNYFRKLIIFLIF